MEMGSDFYPKLEKYEILKILGEGGMGAVFLARHKKIDRLVAIKSLHANLARDPMIRERFKNEAALLAKLTHPNIVTLYDYEERPDGLYLIMEYVEGISLDKLLEERGSFSLEEAKMIMFQILDGVGYAHQHGIIHRDIKPANIILTSDLKVKILDFGIGKIIGDSRNSELTQTGVRIGTLMYMAPEQVAGKGVSVQSDIYALGLTFFQLLTGEYPYDKDKYSDFELSLKIVQEYLLDDQEHPYQSIPEPIKNALGKAIMKDPAQRYESCEAFKVALEMAYAEWTSVTAEELEEFESFVEKVIENEQESNFSEDQQVQEGEETTLTTQLTNLLLEGEDSQPQKKSKRVLFLVGGAFLLILIIGILYYFLIYMPINENLGEESLEEIAQHFPLADTLEIVIPILDKESIVENQEEKLGSKNEFKAIAFSNTRKENVIGNKEKEKDKGKNKDNRKKEEQTTIRFDYSRFNLFLTVNASHKKKLFGNFETVIEVTNTADVPYTSLLFEFEYFNKQGDLIETKEYQFLDEVPAKGSHLYKVKHKAPSGTNHINVILKQAFPIYDN